MTLFLSILFLILAGFFKACMDTVNFKFQDSRINTFINSIFFRKIIKKYKLNKLNVYYYFNKKYSHLLKYKNKDKQQGPAFFGSTTFLVSFTDFLHLSQMLFLNFVFLGIGLLCYNPIIFFSVLQIINVVINIILGKILMTTCFEVFFRYLSYENIFTGNKIKSLHHQTT